MPNLRNSSKEGLERTRAHLIASPAFYRRATVLHKKLSAFLEKKREQFIEKGRLFHDVLEHNMEQMGQVLLLYGQTKGGHNNM